MFRQWRFLHPDNKDNAFKIRPLNAEETWYYVKQPQFYFTPLGQFTTEAFLFVLFLGIFCWISASGITVGDPNPIPWNEWIFWLCCVGYIIFEAWDAWSHDNGLKGYISEWTNWFDSLLVLSFLTMGFARFYAVYGEEYHKLQFKTIKVENELNLIFIISWTLSSILLWLRTLNLFFLSQKVGPFIRMTANMLLDLTNFLQIFVLFVMGFVFGLYYMSQGDYTEFISIGESFRAVFKAALGEYPEFDLVNPDPNDSSGDFRFFLMNALMVIWMVIGTIVLLNLLIALMAKSFDDIHQQNSEEVAYARVSRSYELDSGLAVMVCNNNIY